MGQTLSNELFRRQCDKAARVPRCYHNLQKISRICDKRDTKRTPVCRQFQAMLFSDWQYLHNASSPPPAILGGGGTGAPANVGAGALPPPAKGEADGANGVTPSLPTHDAANNNGNGVVEHIDGLVTVSPRALDDLALHHDPLALAPRGMPPQAGVAAVSTLAVLAFLLAVLAGYLVVQRRRAAMWRRSLSVACADNGSSMAERSEGRV